MPFKSEPDSYGIWQNMRYRCRNPNATGYQWYGGRGIKVCERWNSYETFAADMGPRHSGYSLDRINPDGDYGPDNCRWLLRSAQNGNQRRTKRILIEGKEYVAFELAKKSGLKTPTIIRRASQGLPLAEVIDPARRIADNAIMPASAWQNSAKKRAARTHCLSGPTMKSCE